MRSFLAVFVAALALVLTACSAGGAPGTTPETSPAAAQPAPSPAAAANSTPAPSVPQEVPPVTPAPDSPAASGDAKPATEIATLAGGCFWCVEAVLEAIPGVSDVRSGYMGGKTAKPTYQEVCAGDSGHAEVVQVTFDPAKVTYAQILDWFWKAHDPTTMNQQGADIGTQYRSAIFWHSDAQRVQAEASKAAAQKLFEDPIVTEVTAAGPFTAAESYHQDYFRLNSSQGYCRAVIAPKLKKLGIETK